MSVECVADRLPTCISTVASRSTALNHFPQLGQPVIGCRGNKVGTLPTTTGWQPGCAFRQAAIVSPQPYLTREVCTVAQTKVAERISRNHVAQLYPRHPPNPESGWTARYEIKETLSHSEQQGEAPSPGNLDRSDPKLAVIVNTSRCEMSWPAR